MTTSKSCFFYQQSSRRKTPKRFRKIPEELPQSLRFAHLNPKVAAYLASKENRSLKHLDEDFIDGSLVDSADESGHGTRRSLLPEITEAVTTVKGHLDSTFIPDEETLRLIFEESKLSLPNILFQLERLLDQIEYDCLRVHIPRGVEHRLLFGYKELSSGANYTFREWQTMEAKRSHEKEIAKREEDVMDRDSSHSVVDGDAGKHDKDDHKRKKSSKTQSSRGQSQSKISLADISEDEEATSEHHSLRKERSSSISNSSVHHGGLGLRKTRLEKLRGLHDPGVVAGTTSMTGTATSRSSERKSLLRKSFAHPDDTSIMGSLSESQRSIVHGGYYVSVIQFALSSKACEEKGWILHDQDKGDLEKETILEWARQKLQMAMRESYEQFSKAMSIGHDKPVQFRYYGEAKKEAVAKYNRKTPVQIRAHTALVRGMYPKVPAIMEDGFHHLQEDKKTQPLFLTSTPDGTMIIYYPSGRIAILVSSASSDGDKCGYYTNVYDDTQEMRMLASFTPTGKGCCYHENGSVRFMCYEKGGTLSESNGALSKKWTWPSNSAKLPVTIIVQLNSYISFRCSNLQQMQLIFTCQKETAKVNVSGVSGAVEPREREDLGHLKTGFSFSSLAAKEYAKPFRPKLQVKPDKKQKNKKEKDKHKAQLNELKSAYEAQENEKYEIEADRDLAKLQRKIKNLVEDWMDHYRFALGISSPHIRNMRDTPEVKKRGALSAKSTPGALQSVRDLTSPLPDASDAKIRSPSAPLTSSRSPRPGSSSSVHPSSVSGVKFEEGARPEESVDVTSMSRGTPFPPSVIGPKPKLSLSYPKAKSAGSRSSRSKSARPMTAVSPEPVLPQKGLCPVSLQRELLGEEPPLCKCNRYKIPYITDVEYDELIRESTEKQLIIISVVSSLFPDVMSSGAIMLEQMYSDQNRNRTRPCFQSRIDPYRIFKYDVATAAEYTNYSQPLLLRRHNVVAGMFLMYQNARLVFCDHIFNGYGNERTDFNKQLMKTRKDAVVGLSLPPDFRFSPTKGRHGMRSPWGGEIGGAGVDKHGSPGITLESSAIFHRTDSPSSTSSDSRDIAYPDYPIRSLTANPYGRVSGPLRSVMKRPYRAVTAPATRIVLFDELSSCRTESVK